jgi:hypothetical protein
MIAPDPTVEGTGVEDGQLAIVLADVAYLFRPPGECDGIEGICVDHESSRPFRGDPPGRRFGEASKDRRAFDSAGREGVGQEG